MALHTHQSLSGFIASEPRYSVTEKGDTRFYVRSWVSLKDPYRRSLVSRTRTKHSTLPRALPIAP